MSEEYKIGIPLAEEPQQIDIDWSTFWYFYLDMKEDVRPAPLKTDFYYAHRAGAKSRQAEIDELRAELVKHKSYLKALAVFYSKHDECPEEDTEFCTYRVNPGCDFCPCEIAKIALEKIRGGRE